MTQPSSASNSTIGPDLRAALVAMVRKRVPESDVEDIVQSALAEAIESPHAPKDSDALRRWIFGVAKNKVADFHRRRGRESFELPEVSGAPAPHVEADLLRWAEKNLPPGDDAQKTLDWMLREGEGEKLESIAESEHVPAPRVRQRVSRLRRHLKSHWQREVALLAALGVLATVLVALWLRERDRPQPIANDPKLAPFDPRGEELRKKALEDCALDHHQACLDGLDEARRLDPAGDARPEVKTARDRAVKALAPSPTTAPPELTAPAPKTTELDSKEKDAVKAVAKPKAPAFKNADGWKSDAPTPTPAPSGSFFGGKDVAPDGFESKGGTLRKNAAPQQKSASPVGKPTATTTTTASPSPRSGAGSF